jgi:hypothetical protein
VRGWARSDGRVASGSSRPPCERTKKIPTGGVYLSVGEGGGRIPLRVHKLTGRGRIRSWAEMAPMASLLFSIFFFPFLFSDFSFVSNLLQM